MRVSIQKWGNSLALRIPRSMATESNINKGSYVDLRSVDGKLVIDPVKETEYKLEDLLKKVSEKNIHFEIDTGNPVGKELW
jgi:antitoxin MazE